MKETFVELFIWLNGAAGSVSKPIYILATGLNVVGLTAFLLGVIGATAPCQLTSNSSAIALVTKNIQTKLAWEQTFYFIFGKSVVYSLLGLLTILFGITIQDIPILNTIQFRQVVGPIMIVIGIALLGIIPIRLTLLNKFYGWINRRMKPNKTALGLGITMGFLFCPTLFWLFFGMLIPRASTSHTEFVDPIFFAIGTVLPLILYMVFMSIGSNLAHKMLIKSHTFHKCMKYLSAILFIVSGIFDSINYIFL